MAVITGDDWVVEKAGSERDSASDRKSRALRVRYSSISACP
jgi:hypothetical protein